MTTNNIKEEILGEFDERFCSFNLKSHDMQKDGKPFDGSSVADYCGSADEYIKAFILSSLDKYANAKLEEVVGEIENYKKIHKGINPFPTTEETVVMDCIEIINNLKTK